MRARSQVGLMLVVAAGAAACGGSSTGGGGAATAQQTPAAVQHPKSLVGEVGKDDKFVISLHDNNNVPITNLAAGTYSLKVEDDSTIHDFHLTGAGVDDSTPVGSAVVKTFSVTFKPGTYTFVCDPHAATMRGSFQVS